MRYFCFPGYNFIACQLVNFFPLPQIVIVFNVYVFSLSTNWGMAKILIGSGWWVGSYIYGG